MSRIVASSANRVVRPVRLRPSDRGREMSLADFERAIGQEGYQCELIDGRVDVSPKPDLPHDDLIEWLAELLREYRKLQPEMLTRISSGSRVYLPSRRPATCPSPIWLSTKRQRDCSR